MDKRVLQKYIKAGLSQREIAKRETKSQSTIKYWLDKHSLSTKPNQWNKKYKGEKSTCPKHGETEFALRERGRFRCKKCEADYSIQKRKKTIKTLKTLHGGECALCGYSRCFRALEFHHVDPNIKEFSVNESIGFAYRKMEKEAKKCVLLCANCHREVEDGLLDLDSIRN